LIFELIKGFLIKLDIFSIDSESGKFDYFPKLKKILDEVEIF